MPNLPDFPDDRKADLMRFAEESYDILSGLESIAFLTCYYQGRPAVALCAAMPAEAGHVALTPLFIAIQPSEDIRTCEGIPMLPFQRGTDGLLSLAPAGHA